MIAQAPKFRFDREKHEYFLDGQRIPGISELLERGGLVVGSHYYTEASRVRGSAVHAMCADFDMDALDPDWERSPYAGYVKAYISAMETIRPEWALIEVADFHPDYRFGGRPDRSGRIFGPLGVMEVKTAMKAKHHAIQTGLQSLLVARAPRIPPQRLPRYALYLKESGKWALEEHTDPRDFDRAYALIKEFCHV